MNYDEYININKVAEAKGLTSNRSLRIKINKPESKYIARKVQVNGGTSYEILFDSLDSKTQAKIREMETQPTALVPLNYKAPTETFVSDKAHQISLSRFDIVKGALRTREKYKTQL